MTCNETSALPGGLRRAAIDERQWVLRHRGSRSQPRPGIPCTPADDPRPGAAPGNPVVAVAAVRGEIGALTDAHASMAKQQKDIRAQVVAAEKLPGRLVFRRFR